MDPYLWFAGVVVVAGAIAASFGLAIKTPRR